MNARPTTALALAVVPHAAEAKVEATLTQLLAGAGKVLEAAGCALVGGHTSEGAELALGFRCVYVCVGDMRLILVAAACVVLDVGD